MTSDDESEGATSSSDPLDKDGFVHLTRSSSDVDRALLEEFLGEVSSEGIDLHSIMIFRDGVVAAEAWWWPYQASRLHFMHSATKSFTSTAVGIAIAEGHFGLHDPIVRFFPNSLPKNTSEYMEMMEVEHLLTQTSGVPFVSGAKWRSISTSWIDEFFKLPVEFEPGSKFVYSSATSFMLSAIISATTGESLSSFLDKRFFAPIGMDNYRWDVGPEGINPGGNGLICRTSDFLKLGVIHLQEGMWHGAQLLDSEWVKLATTPKFGNLYGYHWWIGSDENSYFAFGAFGQFSVVFPDEGAVLSITGADDMFATRLQPLIWKYFPAILRSRVTRTSGSDASDHRSMDLRLLPLVEATVSPTSEVVSGRTFLIEPNDQGIESLRLDFDSSTCRMVVRIHKADHEILIGLTDWVESSTTIPGSALHHGYEPLEGMRVVASGGWRDSSTFVTTWQFVESPFRDTVEINFDQNHLILDRSVNVNSGVTKLATVRGSVQM